MFDSHAHINDAAFDEDRDTLIESMFASGVDGWIEVGTSVKESKKAIALTEAYPKIFASVGVHPHELQGVQESGWDELARLTENPRCKAIGEVGLDFSRGVDINFQEAILKKFVTLAQAKKLPMIFHVRSGNDIDAHEELIRILKTYADADRPKGVIHTFSGNLKQAQEYISLGMYVSFSGVVTFKKSDELREIAKTIPLESILVETDCPYLTPEPFRGKRNDPSFCKFVIQTIAELRGTDVLEVEQKTHNNAKKLLGV
ncbi:MAG: TatD family hydrolase [Candidatus Andersenbacteria bacterium]|nr:TatD family hydrolase [Candidatus Andersenbacteria bacterium]